MYSSFADPRDPHRLQGVGQWTVSHYLPHLGGHGKSEFHMLSKENLI